MTYFVFLEDRSAPYTNERGDPCTLDEHLQEIRDWPLTTPDFWDSFSSKHHAIRAAERRGFNAIIVSEELDWRPVARVRASE